MASAPLFFRDLGVRGDPRLLGGFRFSTNTRLFRGLGAGGGARLRCRLRDSCKVGLLGHLCGGSGARRLGRPCDFSGTTDFLRCPCGSGDARHFGGFRIDGKTGLRRRLGDCSATRLLGGFRRSCKTGVFRRPGDCGEARHLSGPGFDFKTRVLDTAGWRCRFVLRRLDDRARAFGEHCGLWRRTADRVARVLSAADVAPRSKAPSNPPMAYQNDSNSSVSRYRPARRGSQFRTAPTRPIRNAAVPQAAPGCSLLPNQAATAASNRRRSRPAAPQRTTSNRS